MPKNFFKLENTTSIKKIPTGGKIHIIGVCGVAMAQLAVLLSGRGFKVSGSDKEFYEPMASLLKASPVTTSLSYNARNIPVGVALVVIGNSISYGNPEVDFIEEKNLPYTLFPKILDEVVIEDKYSIVVAGTHGKSTTSAMIASTFYKMNLDPSYFIGGLAVDLPLSLHSSKGKFCILEGDEYDSAFFAKVPKFSFCHPDICIVNAVEYDHADIYPDLQAINKQFTALVNSIPQDGYVLCCTDFENVRNLVSEWRKSTKCKILTFGENRDCDVRIVARSQNGLAQKISSTSKEFGDFDFEIPLAGAYNAKNALATLVTAKLVGVDFEKAKNALAGFQSVKRRQEIRYQDEKIVLIEDFAHHPTAVEQTITAVKEAYPDKSVWAIFEPRSNTSRLKVFQEDYVKAFAKAQQAILCNVEAREADKDKDLLDVNTLSEKINASGVPGKCLANAKEIEVYIKTNLKDKTALVVMSNGAFGGLIQKLEDLLRKR